MSSPLTPYPGSQRNDHLGAPWPGLIPLRPLGISEILSAAVTLVRSHAAVLCGIAFAFALVASGASIAVLAALPDPAAYFSSEWLTDVSAGTSMAIPAAVLWPTVVSSLLSLTGTAILAGVATVFATEAALGARADATTFKARLGGRWWVLVLIAIVTAGLIFVGFMALIVPGIFLYLALLLAAPAAVMEKLPLGQALRRSTRLGKGLMLRMLGAVAVTTVVSSLLAPLATAALPVPTRVSDLLLTLGVAALISAFTTPWAASVIALLYIDARIRKENLGVTLARAAVCAKN